MSVPTPEQILSEATGPRRAIMEVAMEMSAEHNALFFSLLAASFTARAVGHEVVPMADRYPPLGFTLIRPASHTTGGDE